LLDRALAKHEERGGGTSEQKFTARGGNQIRAQTDVAGART
jgi:hypothetical protein